MLAYTHITQIGNFCKRYNNTLANYFWAIANAISVDAYEREMNNLEQYNAGAA